MSDWRDHLTRAVDRHFSEMVDLRRKLHMYPEASGEELKTSMLVYQLLGDAGYGVRLGPDGKGVIADLELQSSESATERLAIRADIDALRIQDEKNVHYRSRVPGVMHACGHDAHTAMAVTALKVLAEMRAQHALPIVPLVRGIFQPAEETCQGAKEMISAGALDEVAAIIALHVDPSRSVGRIGIRDGLTTANCDEICIRIQGRGGHAARPHETRDPIVAAAQFINWLYQQLPRTTDSLDSVVFTVGTLSGGHHANVIPDSATLRGTLRTLNSRVRENAILLIHRIADAVAAGSETHIEIEFGLSARAVDNDLAIAQLLRNTCEATFGSECLQEISRPSMGSEDFAYYLSEVPGAMVRLGAAGKGEKKYGLHSPMFDIHEDCLKYGARLFATTMVEWALWKADKSRNLRTA
ncbi:MAG: amidohydrolase [Planctomycetota bacterium]